MMDEVDRFDTAEGLNVLAHDFGLYAVKTALDAIPFRAGIGRDTYDGIDDAGREVYDRLAPLAEQADPYAVPDWAAKLIEEVSQDA